MGPRGIVRNAQRIGSLDQGAPTRERDSECRLHAGQLEQIPDCRWIKLAVIAGDCDEQGQICPASEDLRGRGRA